MQIFIDNSCGRPYSRDLRSLPLLVHRSELILDDILESPNVPPGSMIKCNC